MKTLRHKQKSSEISKKKKLRKRLKVSIRENIIRQRAIETFNKTGKITKDHKLHLKITTFLNRIPTIEELDYFIKKFGIVPRCYLTGTKINLNNTNSYHLDHIIPRSQGGKNTFENMGILLYNINISKGSMTDKEFIKLCQAVVNYNS